MSAPVKARGGGYGLDAELAQRAAEKYDYDMESEAREWIEEITGMEIGDDFGEGLRDGVILCELVNKIHPSVVARVETKSKMPFKVMENVSAFLKACRIMGVNEFELFETVDLFELKDLGLVVRCLHALGRTVQKNYPQFKGPTLGVKESSQNVRQFSDRQLAQARNAPVLFNMGSMRTMQRREISRFGDVTFGAEAAKSLHRPPPPPPPPSAEKKEMVARARAAPSPPRGGSYRPPSWSNASSSSSWSEEAAATPSAAATIPAVTPNAPTPRAATPVASKEENTTANLAAGIEKVKVSESPKKKATPPPSPPRSAGLTGLNRATSSKDMAKEEVQEWIEAVMGQRFDADFGDYLKNGVVLCNLMNTIKPGLIPRIQNSPMPFKQMENITAFIKACRAFGVAEFDLFETVDLFELKNLDVVVKCIYALGRTLQKNMPEYTGPILGVKESTANTRTFSEAQLQEAACAVPLLANGGAGIMERLGVDHSASITFKADAAARKSSEPSPVAAAAGETNPAQSAPSSTNPQSYHAMLKGQAFFDNDDDSDSEDENDDDKDGAQNAPSTEVMKNMTSNSQKLPSRTVWS